MHCRSLVLPRVCWLNQPCGADEQTALHACADMGALRTARRLLQDGRIDATARDGKGRTARQLAEQAGHAQLAGLFPWAERE